MIYDGPSLLGDSIGCKKSVVVLEFMGDKARPYHRVDSRILSRFLFVTSLNKISFAVRK